MFFYVNDEPESKFLYTETLKLYCILLYSPARFFACCQEFYHFITFMLSKLSTIKWRIQKNTKKKKKLL